MPLNDPMVDKIASVLFLSYPGLYSKAIRERNRRQPSLSSLSKEVKESAPKGNSKEIRDGIQ